MNTENFRLDEIENLLQLIIKLMQSKLQNNNLEIIQQKDLITQLGISPNTLKSWESKGLKRLEPPIEGTRTIFYKISDVINFLS